MILFLPKWLWTFFIVLFGFYWLNLAYKTDVLYIFQAVMTLGSVYLFTKRKAYLIAVGISFIMVADISYYIQLYKYNLNSNSLFFYLTTSMLYSIGFLLIARSIYEQVGRSLKLFLSYKISVIPVLILIGASISFLFYPLFTLILKGDFNFNSLATITEMSTSIPLIAISYLAIILSDDLSDACLAIGALLVGLVDWGIQFEYLTIGKLSFSYYDFFWFFGLLLIFSRAVDSRGFQVYAYPKGRSLRIQLKILILIASLLPVGSYYLLSRGDLRLSISFFLIGSAMSLLVASIVVQYFSSQLALLTKEIELIFKSTTTSQDSLKLNELSEEWEESLKVILKNKLLQDKLEAENENLLLQKRAELSAQVSHDIRSPLTALNMVLSSADSLQEEKRILVRNALNRINDIANTLLTKNLKMNSSFYESSLPSEDGISSAQRVLLSPLVDSLVSEKRIQYRERHTIEIESDIDQAYGLFVHINATELKRLISNLVNNAIEAFANDVGNVTVAIRKYNHQAVIIIQDNGKGMPAHVLQLLGAQGVTYGKNGTQSGSGLGIYHAKKTIEDSGGSFQIQSSEGVGTLITMALKRAEAPKWFVEKIVLSPNMQIVSLDDDISIHQIWKERLELKKVSTCDIEHMTFTSGADFRAWVSSCIINKNSSQLHQLYLVDYELIKQGFTGLDLIEELGIGLQSILVTSRYEETRIRARCEKLGVRLIPKAMAGFVPIDIEFPQCLSGDPNSR